MQSQTAAAAAIAAIAAIPAIAGTGATATTAATPMSSTNVKTQTNVTTQTNSTIATSTDASTKNSTESTTISTNLANTTSPGVLYSSTNYYDSHSNCSNEPIDSMLCANYIYNGMHEEKNRTCNFTSFWDTCYFKILKNETSNSTQLFHFYSLCNTTNNINDTDVPTNNTTSTSASASTSASTPVSISIPSNDSFSFNVSMPSNTSSPSYEKKDQHCYCIKNKDVYNGSSNRDLQCMCFDFMYKPSNSSYQTNETTAAPETQCVWPNMYAKTCTGDAFMKPDSSVTYNCKVHHDMDINERLQNCTNASIVNGCFNKNGLLYLDDPYTYEYYDYEDYYGTENGTWYDVTELPSVTNATGKTKVHTTQMNTTQMNTTQMNTTQMHTTQMNNTQMNNTQMQSEHVENAQAQKFQAQKMEAQKQEKQQGETNLKLTPIGTIGIISAQLGILFFGLICYFVIKKKQKKRKAQRLSQQNQLEETERMDQDY